jgi:DUF2917 family protein
VSAHILQRLPSTGSARIAGLWKRLWKFVAGCVPRIGADRFSMQLGAGQEFRLRDAAGWTIACRGGSVWITQEADSRDVFLSAGDDFTLDRSGLALILARQDSAVGIRQPAGGQSPESSAACPAPVPDSARDIWLKAAYPECGPWNDPAAYRRSGLL